MALQLPSFADALLPTPEHAAIIAKAARLAGPYQDMLRTHACATLPPALPAGVEPVLPLLLCSACKRYVWEAAGETHARVCASLRATPTPAEARRTAPLPSEGPPPAPLPDALAGLRAASTPQAPHAASLAQVRKPRSSRPGASPSAAAAAAAAATASRIGTPVAPSLQDEAGPREEQRVWDEPALLGRPPPVHGVFTDRLHASRIRVMLTRMYRHCAAAPT